MHINMGNRKLFITGIGIVGGGLLAVGLIQKEARGWAFLGLMIALYLLCWACWQKGWTETAFHARFILAGGAFIFCVLFEFTGSSLGCWAQILGREDNDILLGISRMIRSDEWAVSTPMAWSQFYAETPFQYFSEVLRGCPTDVFLEFGQAVNSVLMVFRPFYLGYLFLPLSMGMAFFWCGRLIVLFMVSFEFGRLITQDRRGLSVIYALAVVLAPVVSWWFAINGLVEMLIYIQLSVLMIRRFMRTDRFYTRAVAVGIVVICAGGYILAMYPAWQTSMIYALLALVIWVFVDNFRNCHMKAQDWGLILAGVVILLTSMGLVLYYSQDTIQTLMNTAYPGKRFATGGGGLSELFTQYSNLWLGIKNVSPYANASENSRFIDLFPLCWILPAVTMVKSRKKDFLSIALYVSSVILTVYIVFGIPTFLAKWMILGYSTATRAVVASGFCNLILLFRGVSLATNLEKGKWIYGLGIGSFLACLCVWVAYSQNPAYFSTKMLVVMLFLWGALICGVFVCAERNIRFMWCCGMAAMLFISGGIVNPLRSGVSSIESLPEVQGLMEFRDENSLWIVEGASFPMHNLPIMVGLPTVNSTNVYPDLEKWRILDPSRQYEDVYNRYAHITVFLVEEEHSVDKFQHGIAADQFTANLTVDDLRALGVTHILSTNDLSHMDGVRFVKNIDSVSNLKVYSVY